MNTDSCSIFFHNYYGDHEDWIRFFSEKITIPFVLYYNIVEDSVYNITEELFPEEDLRRVASGPFLKKIIFRRSSNQGKDIGGKLVLLDACLREREKNEYSVFLHDKKSPHTVHNEQWRERLFGIIDASFIHKTLNVFQNNKEVGIIAGSHSINNEYDYTKKSFVSNNHVLLTQWLSELDLRIQDYRYVAGTMFWARSLPFLDFFTSHPPLDIRKVLEKGNVRDEDQGSQTHSWERLLSWLIFAQGYTIKRL